MAEGPDAPQSPHVPNASADGAPEHLYSRVIAATSSGVMITDARQHDHPLLFVNHACERLTGHAASEALGRNPRFLQGPDTDRGTVAQVRAAVREGRYASMIAKNYRKDGTPLRLELAVSPVLDATGRCARPWPTLR